MTDKAPAEKPKEDKKTKKKKGTAKEVVKESKDDGHAKEAPVPVAEAAHPSSAVALHMLQKSTSREVAGTRHVIECVV